MPTDRGLARMMAGLLIIAALAGAIVLIALRNSSSGPAASSLTQRRDLPVTLPATRAVTPPPRSYVDVIRAAHRNFPATQPMDATLPLNEAAHVLLPDPLYICPRGDLWITRSDAPPTADVLSGAGAEQIHIVPDRPVFVHWTTDEKGKALPTLIVRTSAGPNQFELASGSERRALPQQRSYHWDRALSWNDNSIIVPTDTGVGIIQLAPQLSESYHDLATAPAASAPTTAPAAYAQAQFLLDLRGVLAWIPWEGEKLGSRGAARYVDGKWIDLTPENGWPERIVHLVPLLDGSVLQLVYAGKDTVQVTLNALDKPEVDQKRIDALVDDLSNADSQKRAAAMHELTRYGPGLWPILEQKLPTQPPEAQQTMRQLLRDRTQPTLGGMTVQNDQLHLVARLPDSGVVFYAPDGISVPQGDADPMVIAPAWLSIRPGRSIEMLDHRLTDDLSPTWSHLTSCQGEWVVVDEFKGPCVYIGNELVPLLKKKEAAEYSRVIGVDRRGRWLFGREPDSAARAATAPATTAASAALTLILDPTLPDPTPRLPVWELVAAGGSVGWDQHDWPAMQRGGAFALTETGWMAMKDDPLITEMDNDAATTAPAAATVPAAATAPATRPGPCLLSDPDGRRYYDGRSSLRVIDRDGGQVVWSLPLDASAPPDGKSPVFLIRSREGLLFLFNDPGRVARIRPTPGEAEPFVLDAVFTHKIPQAAEYTRVWLDPAGRIDIAYDGDSLSILFPSGRIPQAISDLMPAADQKEASGEDDER